MNEQPCNFTPRAPRVITDELTVRPVQHDSLEVNWSTVAHLFPTDRDLFELWGRELAASPRQPIRTPGRRGDPALGLGHCPDCRRPVPLFLVCGRMEEWLRWHIQLGSCYQCRQVYWA